MRAYADGAPEDATDDDTPDHGPPGTDPMLVLLAGGRGARFGGLKQLVPVGPADEPLAAYALYDAALAGLRRAVLVCPPGLGPDVRERVAAYAPAGMALRVVEQPRGPGGAPRGTAHAVLCARRAVGAAPLAVANADDFYGRGAVALVAAFLGHTARRPSRRTHAVVAYRVEETLALVAGASRALCVTDGHDLLEIVELRDVAPVDDARGPWRARGRRADGTTVELAAGTPVSMNLWGFDAGIMDGLARRWEEFRAGSHGPGPAVDEAAAGGARAGRRDADGPEFQLPAAVNALLAERAIVVRLLPTDEPAFGLTTARDLPPVRDAIARLVAEGRYPADLRSRGRERRGRRT